MKFPSSVAIYMVVQNHSYLWGSMLGDCQNIAGSWGHNFVSNWFVALQYKTIYFFVKHFLVSEFVGKGTHEIHEH